MSQLTLFAEPMRCGMPRVVAEKINRAQADEVQQAYLAIARARPDEWLDYRSFRAPRERYNLTSCWSRPLGLLVRAGLIEDRRVYSGSETPGPDYTGFHNEWRAVAPTA
jgi:hypothetical protein